MSGRLINADVRVGWVDGVDVRFVGVEISDRGLTVEFQGVPSDETHRRDELYERRLDSWARRRKEHGLLTGKNELPQMPGVDVLSRVSALVSDDAGTEYAVEQGQVAGTGTEWDASWLFVPAPPGTATRLRLRFAVDGQPNGQEHETELI